MQRCGHLENKWEQKDGQNDLPEWFLGEQSSPEVCDGVKRPHLG